MNNYFYQDTKHSIFSLLVLAFLTASSPVFSIDFDFTDLSGEKHKLSEYKGKWVIINFWATWCPPCRHELPDLSDFHLENEDVVVLGVNYEPGVKDEELKKFAELYLISYPITRVSDAIINELGELRGLPTSFVISPEGEIAKRITGIVDQRSLDKMISSYQQEKG